MKQVTRGVCVLLFVTLLIGCKKEPGDQPSAKTPTPATTTPAPEKTPAAGATLQPLPPLKQVQVAAPPMLEGALLTVVVSDVQKLIDQVGVVTSQVMPNIDAAGLRRLAGIQFDDPEFKLIPPGGSFAFVLMPPEMPGSPPMPFAVVQVQSAIAAPYAQALSRGRDKCVAMGDVLVFADDDRGLAAARNSLNAIKTQLFANVKAPGIEINLSPPNFLRTFGGVFQQQLPMMASSAAYQRISGLGHQPTPEKIQGMTRFFEGQFRISYSLLEQIQLLQYRISLDGQGLRVDSAIYPTSHSNLAALFDAQQKPFSPDLLTMLPGQGAIRAAGSMNVSAIAQFTQREVRKMMDQMQIDAETQAKAIAHIKHVMQIYGEGDNEFAVEMMTPGQSLFSGGILMTCADADQTLACFTNIQKSFKESGSPEKTPDFKKNVKQHSGVAVHQFGWSQNINQQTRRTPDIIYQNLVGDANYHIAFLDNKAVFALGASPVEALIDTVKAKRHPNARPLAAQQTLGAGQQFYLDLDVGEIVKRGIDIASAAIPPGQPGNPLPQIAGIFDGLDPIAVSARCEGAALKTGLHIKASWFPKAGQGLVNSFMRARETSRSRACQENLAKIDGAKEQYALDENLRQGSPVKMSELVGPTLYLKRDPVCPADGTYTVNNIGVDPTCSFTAPAWAPAHVIP